MTAAAPSRDAPFRWGEVVAAVPRAVWAVAALHVALLLGWSLVTPVYEAPDEPQHVDLVRAVEQRLAYPEYDALPLSEQTLAAMRATGFSATGNPFERTREAVTALDAPPRAERPAFRDLGEDAPSEHVNPAPQHPPLYYALGAVWLLAVPDGAAVDLTVWSLRLLNVLLLAPVPLLVFAAARRLTGRPAVGVLAAVLGLGVPQYLHIGGAVNNDPLLTLLFAALTVLAVAVAGGDLTRPTAVWVGLLGTLALLTKGFALVLPAWLGSAYLVGCVRTGRWRDGVGSAALGGGLVAVLGGWWWVRNLAVHGELQTTLQRFPDANPGFEPTVWTWWSRTGGYFVERFWGSFGWVDVTLSEGAVGAAMWTLLVLLALAFALRPREAPWWRADLVVALLPVVTIFAVVAYGSYTNYAQSGRVTGMQGRYLFPGLPGMAVVAATGLVAAAGRWARVLPLVALVAVGWLQYVGLRLVLFFWYSDGLQDSWRNSGAAVLAWSPVPRPVTAGVVAASAAAAAWVGVELVLVARHAGPEPGTAPALAPESRADAPADADADERGGRVGGGEVADADDADDAPLAR